MTESAFNGILIGLLVFFFGMLVIVLGWIGSRVHAKLDDLYSVLDVKLGEVTNKLGGIERDLRSELTGLDRRVSKIEGQIE